MYYPHKDRVTDNDGACLAYRLASLSAVSGNCLINVNYDGSLNNDNYANSRCGVRPVVCLKSNVKITKNENGAWTLSK